MQTMLEEKLTTHKAKAFARGILGVSSYAASPLTEADYLWHRTLYSHLVRYDCTLEGTTVPHPVDRLALVQHILTTSALGTGFECTLLFEGRFAIHCTVVDSACFLQSLFSTASCDLCIVLTNPDRLLVVNDNEDALELFDITRNIVPA